MGLLNNLSMSYGTQVTVKAYWPLVLILFCLTKLRYLITLRLTYLAHLSSYLKVRRMSYLSKLRYCENIRQVNGGGV